MSSSQLGLWLTVVGAGLATYAIRLSFVAAHGRIAWPAWFIRALSYVPVAVLCAFIFPELLVRNNALDVSPFNARLLAGILAALVAWRTQNVWLTIGVGLVALFVLQAVVGI